MPKITTLLLDCDNTLVLSEDLAFEGCAQVLNEMAAAKSLPLERPFTGPSLIAEYLGHNFRGMLTLLQARYGFTLTPEEVEAYVRREEDAVIARLEAELAPCPGADAALARLAATGRYGLAVVSSSALRRVRASVGRAGIGHHFVNATGRGEEHAIFSAATSLPAPTSKPDPAIYLHALQRLGKTAGECVAVEDSRSGALSATRAGIKVVGYVGSYPPEKRELMAQALREGGAAVVMEDWERFEEYLEQIEAGEA
ncbi:hypothetical protein VTJ83DRAFT_5743 [Remersonia thermophila]|uniref:Uncharacterized protein n=1 Tax=Remersonia thermophila TaxID=72144 RepID=A0ABR4D9C5_9PEZI